MYETLDIILFISKFGLMISGNIILRFNNQRIIYNSGKTDVAGSLKDFDYTNHMRTATERLETRNQSGDNLLMICKVFWILSTIGSRNISLFRVIS